LPEFNEEFVKDISDFETVEEYKADLKKTLLKKKQESNASEKESEILKALENSVIADIPEVLIKNKLNFLINEFENTLKKQGIKLGDYIKYSGMNLEKHFLPKATSHVKIDLALKKISELEKISVTEEELDFTYAKLSKTYPKFSLEQIKKVFPESNLMNELLLNKTLDFVTLNAVEE
jgi:trigger factor